MDLGSPFALLHVCAMLICLLGAARGSSDKSCVCPEIPKRNDTQPPAKNCFQISETFRYTCKEPNLRKAGTSNFIKCKQTNNVPAWSPPSISLKCIPDPNRTTQPPPSSTVTPEPNTPTTQPPESTVTKGHTDIPHDFTIATTVTGKEADVTETEAPHPTTATLSAASTAVIGCASVAIVCALIGISFFCYKRRSKSNIPQHMPEERLPMNHFPPKD